MPWQDRTTMSAKHPYAIFNIFYSFYKTAHKKKSGRQPKSTVWEHFVSYLAVNKSVC